MPTLSNTTWMNSPFPSLLNERMLLVAALSFRDLPSTTWRVWNKLLAANNISINLWKFRCCHR